jgi:RNA recognition motif. (a.k.a. RRM, RBD, or RNP domain)
MAMRLFVGNLPYDMNEAELRVHFAAVGPLSFITTPAQAGEGRSKIRSWTAAAHAQARLRLRSLRRPRRRWGQ